MGAGALQERAEGEVLGPAIDAGDAVEVWWWRFGGHRAAQEEREEEERGEEGEVGGGAQVEWREPGAGAVEQQEEECARAQAAMM